MQQWIFPQVGQKNSTELLQYIEPTVVAVSYPLCLGYISLLLGAILVPNITVNVLLPRNSRSNILNLQLHRLFLSLARVLLLSGLWVAGSALLSLSVLPSATQHSSWRLNGACMYGSTRQQGIHFSLSQLYWLHRLKSLKTHVCLRTRTGTRQLWDMHQVCWVSGYHFYRFIAALDSSSTPRLLVRWLSVNAHVRTSIPPASTGPGLLSGTDLPTTNIVSRRACTKRSPPLSGCCNVSQPLFVGWHPGGPAYAITRYPSLAPSKHAVDAETQLKPST